MTHVKKLDTTKNIIWHLEQIMNDTSYDEPHGKGSFTLLEGKVAFYWAASGVTQPIEEIKIDRWGLFHNSPSSGTEVKLPALTHKDLVCVIETHIMGSLYSVIDHRIKGENLISIKSGAVVEFKNINMETVGKLEVVTDRGNPLFGRAVASTPSGWRITDIDDPYFAFDDLMDELGVKFKEY